MTTEASGGAPAPVQPAPVPAPAATPPAAATPAPPAKDPDEQAAWLKGRLEQARTAANKALLAELGVDDAAKAKAFIEAGLAAENEKKSLAEKLAEQATALTTTKAQAEKYSGIIAQQASAQMSALSAEQQAAVKAIAGEDPAEQLRAVIALAPTWKAAPVTETPGQKPAASPPASTAATVGGPPPAGSTSPPDHKAEFEKLQQTNPVAAARYARAHRVFQS
jgi:hypothetical protein